MDCYWRFPFLLGSRKLFEASIFFGIIHVLFSEYDNLHKHLLPLLIQNTRKETNKTNNQHLCIKKDIWITQKKRINGDISKEPLLENHSLASYCIFWASGTHYFLHFSINLSCAFLVLLDFFMSLLVLFIVFHFSVWLGFITNTQFGSRWSLPLRYLVGLATLDSWIYSATLLDFYWGLHRILHLYRLWWLLNGQAG